MNLSANRSHYQHKN